MSCPPLPTRMSSPGPPVSVSLPALPIRMSSPSPPLAVSCMPVSPVALMMSSPPRPLMTILSVASKLVIVTSRVTPASLTMLTVTTPLLLLIVITSSPLVALMTTVSTAPSGAPFTPRSILTRLTSVPVRSLTVTVSAPPRGVSALGAVDVPGGSRSVDGNRGAAANYADVVVAIRAIDGHGVRRAVADGAAQRPRQVDGDLGHAGPGEIVDRDGVGAAEGGEL